MDIVKDSVELDITSHELTQKTNEVVVSADTALEISGLKKEYSIVGDSLYAVVSSDSPPQWLANIIDNVVNSLIGQKLTALDTAVNSINASLRELEIAKNQYQQLINIEETIDGVLVSKLETLNATVQQNSASIIDLDVVKTTADEALAITINHLNSEINNGEISSLITQLNTTIANNELAAAESINQLEAVYNENESTVREILSTSTGEYTAEANAITELNVNINDAVFGATGLENTLRGEITSEGARVESKFAYNSLLSLGGVSYSSGFGLATSLTDGTIPVGDSEFWIKADKFKLMSANNSVKSSYSPFSVDANTGNILMNGNVRFLNTTGSTGTLQDVVQGYVETVQVGDKNINITDNLIPMVSLIADTNNAGYQFIGTPMKSNAIGISAYAEPQIQMDVGDEVYSPYVTELALAYYYRFGITGVTSLSGVKLITIDAANTVTYTDLVVTLDPGQSLQSNQWYVVEGLTNPTGSSGGSDGSIRTANGTKIGTVNVYVLPTGATKLLLGWVGPCTISRGKLAKVSADTVTGDVASIDYVDTAITNAPYVLPAEVADAINNNTTTINGSKITTGSITANQIAANSITGNNIAANVAISAPTINGGVINGGAINGVNITGAVIKASWIDYSSTGHLTNWAYFTPSTIPAQYETNFAHNSTNGSLLVDNNGYVRLPKVSKVIVDAYLYKVGSYANVSNYGSFTYNGHDLNIRSYDSYATTSTNRLLNSNSRIIFDRAGFTLLGLRGGAGYNGGAIGTCSANWRIGTDVFTYYGLSQATNQGGDPHIYTTRLTKNGVALMDVTATVPSAPINSVLYNQTLTSSGMSVTIYAVGANLTVTIPNAINDLVGYRGIDTNISVGVCTGYASDGLSTGMLCDIPSGAEFY